MQERVCTYKKLCSLPKYGECFSNCCMIPGYMQDFSSIGPVVSDIQNRDVHVRTCSGTPNVGRASATAVCYLHTYKVSVQSDQ